MATPTEEPYKVKVVLLSHKDSDILTLSTAKQMLPLDFPTIETVDLCSLKVDADMLDVVNEKILGPNSTTSNNETEVLVIVRLLGRGVPGMQHLQDHARKHNHHLIVVSGIPGSFEPDLTAMCNNVSVDTINEVMKYFHADGCANNMNNMLRYLADHLFKCGYEYDPAVSMPDHGLYHPKFDGADETRMYLQDCFENSGKPTVAVIFYRCHYLSGNRAFVDALLDELDVLGVNSIGLFTESLRAAEPIGNVNGHDVERFPTALTYLLDQSTGKGMVDVLISSMVSRHSV